MENTNKISVEAVINSSVEKVWDYWTIPNHITQWNNASEEWHTPYAENDLRVGGSFLSRMAAKDGSFSFDFGGKYDQVDLYKLIEYTLDDARKVIIHFEKIGNTTKVIEIFDAENENPIEMQKNGWQAILNNFKNYTENN
jgi:uncharacterized protein YndB with AHSA1/START domain